MFEIKKSQILGMIPGVAIVGLSFLFWGTSLFFFIVWMGVMIAASPFVITTIQKTTAAGKKEEMFLEFTRNLVESVRTGTPISKSIINMKKRQFGVLTRHVEKLANQIAMGIPLKYALEIFAKDINNETVTRTISLIGQAEKAGGNIGEILEAVAKAVSMADKLKKERKAAISTLVVQSYIIFFVFLVIILVMQYYIVPMISGIASIGSISSTGITESATGGGISAAEISKAFLYLLIVQGLFSGLTTGKLAEGDIKAGIKHSFALILISFLITTGASLILGK